MLPLLRQSHAQLARRLGHIDRSDSLDHALLDAARAVEELRAQGRTVLVHCVQDHSRTPPLAPGAKRRLLR